MSMDNISDVRREQACCFACLGCFCGCCFPDMGDIILYGTDESQEAHGNSTAWKLRRIANSQRVHKVLTNNLQERHAAWRKQGRNLGQKLQQVKQDVEQEQEHEDHHHH